MCGFNTEHQLATEGHLPRAVARDVHALVTAQSLTKPAESVLRAVLAVGTSKDGEEERGKAVPVS